MVFNTFFSGTPARISAPGTHFPRKYKNKKYRPNCTVCSSTERPGWKRKQTCFFCNLCNRPMCPVPCFELYHSYVDYVTKADEIVYGHSVQQMQSTVCVSDFSQQGRELGHTF
ncbi:hypothetical protein BaRGS_00028249 [Batillaria attramentaria]|uniref:PiggyBac transposable element-derived protein 4 C-terminal zinc-finger domain-containing protein n=1 Tax=Batillaria attramentaria TaxID=370345 RepID=A0ABD0JZG8_9CAEN